MVDEEEGLAASPDEGVDEGDDEEDEAFNRVEGMPIGGRAVMTAVVNAFSFSWGETGGKFLLTRITEDELEDEGMVVEVELEEDEEEEEELAPPTGG